MRLVNNVCEHRIHPRLGGLLDAGLSTVGHGTYGWRGAI
jgi:hypothetical protein